MADKKISELTEKTAPDNDDLFALVDSEADPIETKKIKASNITKIHSDLTTGVHGAGAGTLMNTSSHLDNTAGGTDGETSKAPTSNVLYDHGVAATGVHGVGSDYVCGAKSSGIKARDFVKGWTSKTSLLGNGVDADPVEVFSPYFYKSTVPVLQTEMQFYNWTSAVTGTGAVTKGYGELNVSTGATAGSTARARGYRLGWIPWQSRDLDWAMQFVLRGSSANGKIWIKIDLDVSGDPTDEAVGFRVDNNALKGIVHNGTTLTVVDLSTTFTVNVFANIGLKYRHGDKVEWYVNDVLKGSSTSIPSAQRNDMAYLVFNAQNNADATDNSGELWCHGWRYI